MNVILPALEENDASESTHNLTDPNVTTQFIWKHSNKFQNAFNSILCEPLRLLDLRAVIVKEPELPRTTTNGKFMEVGESTTGDDSNSLASAEGLIVPSDSSQGVFHQERRMEHYRNGRK